MNDTSFSPPPGADQAPGPGGYQPPEPPRQDLDRLRRSTTDRYLAGVAGGIGRHFGIDPTIIRVLLAVLTLFGGAGVVIYGVCWIFVPEDGSNRAVLQVNGEPRKILLLAAAGVAFLLAMGDAFSGFNAGWPIASVAVVIGIVLIARDRRVDHRRASAGWVAPSSAGYAGPYAAAAATDPAAASATATPQGWTTERTVYEPTTPLWQAPRPIQDPPPWTRPPLIPPRPKRTGIIWFWPTLALILISVLALAGGPNHVAAGVYPAVALGITGAMLLIGSFAGRPGGLVLIGLVSALVLAFATVVGTFHLDGRNIEATPKVAADVQSSYRAPLGRIDVDLTKVSDPAALAGRVITMRLNAGQVMVTVPRSMNVIVHAKLGFAGGIDLPGYDSGGVQDKTVRRLVGTPTTTAAPLVLDLNVRAGQIDVEQQ
ncbi:MAG TPA: PspC domain-containing protein [Marmoricola sp.]|nr:PspC domain-containing protein [Marmoricola sp.]